MDVVVGMGEVGKPLLSSISCSAMVSGIDMRPELCVKSEFQETVEIMHVCFPYSVSFTQETKRYCEEHKPKLIAIHSTVKPHTTEQLQSIVEIPVIYSPIRGVHARMIDDLKRYVKYYALYPHPESEAASKLFRERFHGIGIKTKEFSSPLCLEFAKVLVDTTYYAWLIVYSQITNEICAKEGLNYDELWEFAQEIHQFLGNRPKMYPGVIGGHCLIPNLRLIDDPRLKFIAEQNSNYEKFIISLNSHAQKLE